MEHLQYIIIHSLTIVVFSLFFGDAIFLFLRGRNNRARKILATILLIWGSIYFVMHLTLYHHVHLLDIPFLSPQNLFMGNFHLILLLLFPIEVLLPGWLNGKRLLWLFGPVFLVPLLYWGILRLLGEPIDVLTSAKQFLLHVGHFNVWFRLVILAIGVFYLYMLFHLVRTHMEKYDRWCDEHFSNHENINISWMNTYAYIVLIMYCAFLLIVFCSHPWVIIFHTLVTISCFSYLFYKGLFHENPYSEDFFGHTDNEEEALNLVMTAEPLPVDELTTLNDRSFDARMSSYVTTLKEWMDTEKPYLYKDFKLTDVARILPLNRSYLSRVFNEGFGQNFSEFVRSYRVAYARELLQKHPDLPLFKVAELSGFSTDSTFVRSFEAVTGVTPMQFKRSVHSRATAGKA